MDWKKPLSAVVVMSISVMLIVSVLPIGAVGNGNTPLMFVSDDCAWRTDKCPVSLDKNKNEMCDDEDKIIMMPKKVAMLLKPCP